MYGGLQRIFFVGNSGINLCWFLVSVSGIIGNDLLLHNGISIDLFQRSFLYDLSCFLYAIRLF